MIRVLAIIFGITVLALLASGLTEASLVLGHKQMTSIEPTHIASPVPTPPVPTPPVLPPVVAAPVTPTATVNAFVHMRADRSTSSAIVTDLNAGAAVQYAKIDDGLWQAVTYQGQSGYVYKSYLNY